MDRLVRARVLLAEAEALGVTIDDLVAGLVLARVVARQRVGPGGGAGADPGRVRGHGGTVVQRQHRRHLAVVLAGGSGPLR